MINFKNKFIDFIESLLLSYSAILFCNSLITGLIFLFLTFIDIGAGILGLIGGISAVFFANKMKIPPAIIRTGIFGCNAILTGLAWGYYFNLNLTIVILLIISAFLSNKFMLFLLKTLGEKWSLPTLSISFVLFAWIGIIIFKLSGFSAAHPLTLSYFKGVEYYLTQKTPAFFQIMCTTLSHTFFQKNILVGILAFAGIFACSRISFLFALLGSLLIYLTLYELKVPPNEISYIGFNSIFTVLAFGGFFLRLNLTSGILAIIALFITLLMSWAIKVDLSYIKLPLLAFPFNLTTLFLLSLLKQNSIFAEKFNLYPIPLDRIKNPEKNLNNLATNLSLPFYGIWKVSQGIDGKYTHKDIGKYALDFWTVDDNNSTFRSFGVRLEDYYSFGLPLIAPCSGEVIKIKNDIPDNPVGRPNFNFPWGNYILIKCDNKDIYVEISHLKCGSILVGENENIIKGQLFGKCGNSGRSYQPHIHFQVQDKPELGAMTLPFMFSKFIRINHIKEKLETNKIPREGELIKNFESG